MSECDSAPRWLRVSDHDDVPAEPDAKRVDLNRCPLWIRKVVKRRGDYAGEDCLRRTSGGRWFIHHVRIDDFTRERGEHAWWARRSEVVEWFLAHPDVEPPVDLIAELDGFDATSEPAPAESKPIKAPATEPQPAQEAPAPSVAISKETKAMAIATDWMRKGRPLVITEIAKAVPCSESYLHRCQSFKALLAKHRQSAKAPPRGWKSRETRDVEAYDDRDRRD